jgi:predicted RND superfamily exporter protein
MIERFARGVIRWRWLVMGLTLLAVVAAASGARFLTFSNDYRDFFSEKNPELEAFEAFQAIYTKSDNALFVVAPKDGQVFSRETLAAVVWLTERSWQMPYARRVDSIANFQHTASEGDDLVVRNLVEDARSLSDEERARIKEIALKEPLLLDRLVSPSADVTGVSTTFLLPEKSNDATEKVTVAARELIEEARRLHPMIDIHLTGGVLLDNAFGEYARIDITTLTPIMYGIILLVTFLTLRSVAGTVAVLLITGFSVITTVGLLGWTGFQFTPPSVATPTIVLILAVANTLHLLVSMFQGMRRGKSRHDALVESLSHNLWPIFFTTLTDVIGFLTMNFSEVPPFRDLGNGATLGALVAFVYSIFFLPAFMAVIPLKIPAVRDAEMLPVRRIGDFVIRHRKRLLWGTTVTTLVLFALIPLNELNDRYVHYFDEKVDFRQATDFAEAHLGGIYEIHYSLRATESGGIAEPEYLNKVEAFAQWYRQQPGVVHVNTLTDTMKRLSKNMHGDDPAWYRIPDDRSLAAQYLLLYELSLPFGLDLNDQINVDKSATRLTVTLKNLTSNEILALDKEGGVWLRQHFPETTPTQGTGIALMFAHIGQRNIVSMIHGNIAAILLISGSMILTFRSLKLGLISLIPNLVPAGMAFGLWGLFVGEVGLALSVVSAMTLGIVVDDTIHFLSQYLQAKRDHGMEAEAAIRYAFSQVGSAILATTLILVAGFLVLTFSSFTLNSSLGAMTALTFILALLADFLLLAPLLMQMDGKREVVEVRGAERERV